MPGNAEDRVPPDLSSVLLLPSPTYITARPAQLVFHVAQLLFELIDFLLLGRDLCVLFVHLGAAVLLFHGLAWIAVILNLGLLRLALQDVQFLLSLRDLSACLTESLPPGSLVVFVGRLARGSARRGRICGSSLLGGACVG